MKKGNINNWMYIGFIIFMFVGILTACSDEEATDDNDLVQESEKIEVEIIGEDSGDNNETTRPELIGSKDGSGGFLWRANHNGNTVYMLGSIHVATEDFYPLHEKIINAFKESEYLAVEADVVGINIFEMQKQINEIAMYQDETVLADQISKESYEKLDEILSENGMPIELVSKYKPWYVYMLVDGFDTIKMGYDSTLGIDYYFLEAAHQDDKKEIIELESMEFQLNLLDSFSLEIQNELLDTSIENYGKQEETMHQLAELWKSGDAEGLEEFVLSDEGTSESEAEFLTGLLDDRNVGMTDKIEGFLNGDGEEVYFVIVGSAHYFGEKGIIKLLEERGYTVDKEL